MTSESFSTVFSEFAERFTRALRAGLKSSNLLCLKNIAERELLFSLFSAFNLLFLAEAIYYPQGSERYVKGKLESLSSSQISKLKEAFIKNNHPRSKKEFAVSRHQPFGKTSDYVRCIENADPAK